MKRKISIILCLCFLLPILTLSSANAQQPSPGTQTIVDTQKDPNGKLNARYDPSYTLYCSAVLITPNMWLTAKHCAGNQENRLYWCSVSRSVRCVYTFWNDEYKFI